MKFKEEKDKMIISVLGLVLLLVFVVGITYAVFTYTKKGNIENTIRTGKITMSYREGENGITLENAYPMEDSVGKVLSDPNQIFDFTVNINLYGSKTPVSYEVTAEKDENLTLGDSDVRIYLEKSSDGTSYHVVSEPSSYVAMGNADDFGAKETEMLLDRGNTTDTVTYNYRLRMWVGSSYQVSGEERHFTLKVNVYGNDGVNVEVNGVELDKSSATVKLRNSLQLNATITPAFTTGDRNLTWTSSNPKIATVTNTGLVETKGVGTTTITAAASNGKSASASIKVEVDNPNIVGAYTYNEATCPTGREETCEVNTCLLNKSAGSCSVGTTISYRVNENETVDFHVLKDNGSTMDLVSVNSVLSNTAWNKEGDNTQGPITLLNQLESKTNSWTNLNTITYNGTTYGNNQCATNLTCSSSAFTMTNRSSKARMLTMQDVVGLGCSLDHNSCPIWLYNNQVVWLIAVPVDNTNHFAWYIDGAYGALGYGKGIESDGGTSKAVVHIHK